MNFILCNWNGFEIDSSEFSASISSDKPWIAFNSLCDHFDNFYFVNGISSFSSAINKALEIDKEKVEHIKVEETTLLDIYEKYKDLKDNDLKQEDVCTLIQACYILVENFNNLKEEFYACEEWYDCYISFAEGEEWFSVDLSPIGESTRAHCNQTFLDGPDILYSMIGLDVKFDEWD
ncbi:MAG: hypothetical protein GPJ51_12465 [Candidatus Heimdallarchaeota archaeon]|nr:hypothetical protein [Candidatus Heimdallarchaeota archaeon]